MHDRTTLMSHTYTRKYVLSFLLVLLVCQPAVFAQGLEYVPLEDPVYAFLEYARGQGAFSFLPQVRPYLEADVVALLSSIRGDENLETRATAHLKRFEHSRSEIGRVPFGENGALTLDATVDFDVTAPLNRIGDTIPTLSVPFSVAIGLSDTILLSLDVVPAFAYWGWEARPEKLYDDALLWDYYNFVSPLDGREEGFGHSGYHEPGGKEIRILFNGFNQFSVDLDYLMLHSGRASLDWGPSAIANLVLSGSSKPYEFIGFNMPLGGSGTFSWMTGFLQDFAYEAADLEKRLITAHRIEYQFTDWFYFAIYESVLYDYMFELAYLNPLSLFYVAEVAAGSDDTNILGGADIIVNLPNLKLYGSFFADDWDAGHLFELNSAHNEWAGIIGASHYGLVPGLTLNGELVYLSHWMYTHYTWVSATSVGKSYQHYGSHIGHFLEPNSWMGALEATYRFEPAAWGSFSFMFIQDGRGDIDTEPDWAAESALHGVSNYRDIHYTFLDRGKPGFEIDTTVDLSLAGSYEFARIGLEIGGRYSFQYSFSQETESMTVIPDSGQFGNYLTIEMSYSPGPLLR